MKKMAIALLCVTTSLLGVGDDPLTVKTGRLILHNDSGLPQTVYQNLGTEKASCVAIPCSASELFESKKETVISIVLWGRTTKKIVLSKDDSGEDGQSLSLPQINISELLKK